MSNQVSTDSQPNSDFSFLPPKLDQNSSKDRVFRTSISASDYVRLESEAVERGTTPYRLAGLIVSAFLNGQLQPVTDS